MPQQLRSQLISAFLGDGQGQGSLLLNQAYSPDGSVNLYIDKEGQIRPVPGWVRQNATPFTTDTGGSAAVIRGLFYYRNLSGSTLTTHLLFVMDDGVNEWEVHYSTDLGVTKTFLLDAGAGSVGQYPSFAMFGNQLFIANGIITPRYWDGTTLNTAGASQIAAPTLSDAGAGPLNGSGYKYRLVSILANKQRKPGYVSSASLDVQNRRIGIAWTADPDVNVIGYELYRTSGTGLDFYFVAYIDGRTTVAYEDSMPDTTLITKDAMAIRASVGDPPPITYFVVAHKGRLFWIRTATLPRTYYWSDAGDPDSVYQDLNNADCTDAGSIGDYLTGGTGEYEGQLVLWLNGSIWVHSGTGQYVGAVQDWRKRRSNADTGTPSSNTVVRVAQGAVFMDVEGAKTTTAKNLLAFFSSHFDIRLFDGINDTIVSQPKRDTLARCNPAYAYKAFGYDDTDRQMAVWCFPIDSATEPNYSVAWNYQFGTWHEWSGTTFTDVIAIEPTSTSRKLIAADSRIATGALLYQIMDGTARDGAAITASLMTKALYPPVDLTNDPDLSYEKRAEKLFLLFEKSASPVTVTVEVFPHDAVPTDTAEITQTVTGSSRAMVKCQQSALDPNPGRYFYGVGWRFRFSVTSAVGDWVLKGLQQLYAVLPGRTR